MDARSQFEPGELKEELPNESLSLFPGTPEEADELLRGAEKEESLERAKEAASVYGQLLDSGVICRFGLAKALALVELLEGKSDGVRDGCDSFFLDHDAGTRGGVLLLHGFGSSPPEMRNLGDFLHSRGFTVYGVRLAGHATNLKAFAATGAGSWMASVERGSGILRNAADEIFIVGQSLGGALALMYAADNDVSGIVTISAPVGFKDRKINLTRIALLRLIFPYQDVNLTQEESRFIYDRRPTAAIAEILKLRDRMVEALDRVSAPLMIVQAADDPTVLPSSARYIFDKADSDVKRFHWLQEGGHILTHDSGPATSELFDEINGFLVDNQEGGG